MTRTTPDYVSTEPEIMPSGLWTDFENSTSEISGQSDRLHDDTGNITRAATTIFGITGSLVVAAHLVMEEIMGSVEMQTNLYSKREQIDHDTLRKSRYQRNLISRLQMNSEFIYQPGYDNEVRGLVIDEALTRPYDFIEALSSILRDHAYFLTEDIRLELIDTMAEVSSWEIRNQIVHLMQHLLRSQSDAIVDSAVDALSPDNLSATEALPALRRVASATANDFLRIQSERAIEGLEVIANAAAASAC